MDSPTTTDAPLFAAPGFAIGALAIPTRVLMAPMMGYNEPPLRLLFRRFGSGLCLTEMIKPDQLFAANNRGLLRDLVLTEAEHPVGAQIAAREPELSLRAALRLRELGFDLIDLNFGCPLKKECQRGFGAGMLRRPEAVAALVSTLVRGLDCPVTVKLRSGWSDDEETAAQIARVAVDNGAASVCVHGRSKLGWYRTANDRAVIARVRAAVPDVPLIANGDVVDADSAASMIRETGADALMIGRACVGDPWIFQRLQAFLTAGLRLPAPSFAERRAVWAEHAAGLRAHTKAKIAHRLSRKYAFFYFDAWHDAESRALLAKTRTLAGIEKVLDLIADRQPQSGARAALREA